MPQYAETIKTTTDTDKKERDLEEGKPIIVIGIGIDGKTIIWGLKCNELLISSKKKSEFCVF